MTDWDRDFRVDERVDCGDGVELVMLNNGDGEGWPFMLNPGEDVRGCACPRCAPHDQLNLIDDGDPFGRFIGLHAPEDRGEPNSPQKASTPDVTRRSPTQPHPQEDPE